MDPWALRGRPLPYPSPGTWFVRDMVAPRDGLPLSWEDGRPSGWKIVVFGLMSILFDIFDNEREFLTFFRLLVTHKKMRKRPTGQVKKRIYFNIYFIKFHENCLTKSR